MVQVIRKFSKEDFFKFKCFATLGKFDGLHLGHQSLLSKLQDLKLSEPGSKSLVISFYPPPQVVLKKISSFEVLTSLHQSIAILDSYQVDYLCLFRFTSEVAQLTPDKFIKEWLFDRFNVSRLVIGADAAIGKNRTGDVSFIKEYFTKYNRQVDLLENFELEGARIGAGKIKEWLRLGDLERVSVALSRYYSVLSKVVKGDQRGRLLGFPTANLARTKHILPPLGVYASFIKVRGIDYKSVTNVGIRPTFDQHEVRVETHILDYPGDDIYGDDVEVSFVKRIRPERKFAGVDELKIQIAKDLTAARAVFASI